MTLILIPEDLNKFISKYELNIYSYLNDNQSDEIDQLKNNIYLEIESEYNLIDKTDNLNLSKKIYIQEFISNQFLNLINHYKELIKYKDNILSILTNLKKLKLPEQRSPEWYNIRDKILTASSLADAIGEGHFSTREELLIQKCGGPRGKIPFSIVEWGVMYEPVATKFYEIMNNLKIVEFGLVPHPTFKIFGASPDGICDIDSPKEYIGRMLEIKCPPKRKFTKEVPKHYWIQMQGQLETCNLEECDFLQVKISEYFSESDFKNDIYHDNNIIKEGYSSLNLPKGLVLAFITNKSDENPDIKYEYSEFNQSYNDLIKWSDKIIKSYNDKNISYDELKKHWWKIDRYECTLVTRDRKWWLETQPKIIDFWEDVEHYRKEGIQSLVDKKEKKKIKKIKINENKPKQNKNIFEINKEIVDKIQNNYLLDDSESD